MLERKNRVYAADCEEWWLICIAPTLAKAKQLLWQDESVRDWCEDRYTAMQVKWQKGMEAGDLPVGVPDNLTGLKAGFYCHLQENECPICGVTENIIYNAELDLVGCEQCVDKQIVEKDEEEL